jgi:hypothetical protein
MPVTIFGRSAMRNLFALAALMVLVAPLATEQAAAAGAVAIGIAPGGAQNGYASGYEVNDPDIDTAKTDALSQCKKPQANVSGTPANSGTLAAQAKCEVVATFSNKCYAQALDPKDGTPGAGWAVADTQEEADNQAMAMCQNTAGADRSAFCKVFSRACDTGNH